MGTMVTYSCHLAFTRRMLFFYLSTSTSISVQGGIAFLQMSTLFCTLISFPVSFVLTEETVVNCNTQLMYHTISEIYTVQKLIDS